MASMTLALLSGVVGAVLMASTARIRSQQCHFIDFRHVRHVLHLASAACCT